jgi:hypothetical protein
MIVMRLWIIMASAVLLTACSGTPSQADIEQAYRYEVEQVNQMTARLGGGSLAIQVDAVKKLDCQKPDQHDRYRCQVEIETTMPFLGNRRESTELILTSTERGWKILRGLDSSS